MLVFVYGTLREGMHNHDYYLGGAKPVATVKTAPTYTMCSLGSFPTIVEGGETAITGELYDVDDVTLAQLDLLEGHPRMYERKPVTIDGYAAEAYFMPSSRVHEYPPITSGDWVAYVNEPQIEIAVEVTYRTTVSVRGCDRSNEKAIAFAVDRYADDIRVRVLDAP